MAKFRTLGLGSWIELTSEVAWKPYEKSFKENKDRLVKDARNATKVQLNGAELRGLVESLTLLFALAQRI
jgi:hypothetical protein